MNYKINDIISKNILGQDTFVKVTDIKVEEEEPYLDGSYTKEELLELLEEASTKTLVYGKIVDKKDIKGLEVLQELAKKDFYGSMVAGCSGCPYQEKDFKNEMLLEIFHNGEKPECDDDKEDY